MFKTFSRCLIGFASLAAVVSTSHAASKTIVFATLWDKGPSADMAKDHGLGMAHMKMASTMGIRLSTDTAKAGTVVFKVTNSTKETVHEMLVFPYDPAKPFPYSKKDSKINEEAFESLGEVSERDPGKSGELKLVLKPGKYVVLCNIAGHFANGMWSLLTVK
jgi:uncharacterized cupredoxin-like copper-binding protein